MDYKYFQGVPDTQTLLGVLELHKHVFEGAELETEKLKEKNNLIVFVAKEDERVVGFKIGYDYGNRTFYSWLFDRVDWLQKNRNWKDLNGVAVLGPKKALVTIKETTRAQA